MSGEFDFIEVNYTREGEVTPDLTPQAREVLTQRYLRKDGAGRPAETVEDLFWRVATAIGRMDANYDRDPETTIKAFYNLLASMTLVPNSPTFTGAGTELGQLAACFALPLDDSLVGGETSIFGTLRAAAAIQQTGGGNGFSFGRLRQRGARIKTSGGQATGPVGFLKVYDAAFGEISQGGTRRGANMAVLPVTHPDILEFIACKETEGAFSNFNISVGVTDAFMRAVRANEQWSLLDPHTQEVVDTVGAVELFDEIASHAWDNGEPGIIFLDTMNRDNPVPNLGYYETTNPCAEQPLLPYESCCLASINLSKFVEYGNFQWEAFRRAVWMSVHFLDNVIDANRFVDAVPQLKEMAHTTRKIGLGIMGLGDVLFDLGLRYGAPESLQLAGQIMEFMRYHAMLASITLAKARGPFPALALSIFNPNTSIFWQPPVGHDWQEDYGQPDLDWKEVPNLLRLYGIRNSSLLTIAPTGTTGTVAGVEAYGCEPVFALAYTRRMYQAAGSAGDTLTYASPRFERELKKSGLPSAEITRIVSETLRAGSCQGVTGIPARVRNVFVTAGDLTMGDHLAMQAALQEYVDSSISKTINCPGEVSIEDIGQAIMTAWRWGCKGLAIYREGSRHEVVLEKGMQEDLEGMQDELNERLRSTTADYILFGDPARFERPARMQGETIKVATPLGSALVTINVLGEWPHEVIVNVGKGGSDIAAIAEAFGRLISYTLQLPIEAIDTESRLLDIAEQLAGIGGRSSVGFGPNRVTSLPDGIASALRQYLSNEYDDSGEGLGAFVMEMPQYAVVGRDLCPECGEASYIRSEGCQKCTTCGYAAC